MPSKLHTELSRRALVWLSNIATQKGIRGCPEITLCEGYVADAGAILNLQMQWDHRFFKGNYYSNLKKVNGWLDTDDFTFVVESKASRSDFKNTFHHGNHIGDRLAPKANFHFIVVAKGVLPTHLSDEIACEEIPSFWGCLEESRHGLRLLKLPEYCPSPTISLHEFAYRILRFADVRKYMIMDLKEMISCETGSELTIKEP